MAKFTTILAGAISILVMGISAAPTIVTDSDSIMEKRCVPGTATILAPFDIIDFDITKPPSTPGWSSNPLFGVFQYSDNLINYRQLLRFNPPSSGNCAWVMNLPQSRYNAEVLQDKPANNGGPVHLSFWGVEGSYKAGDSISDVNIKPGSFGVSAVQPGEQSFHQVPCDQIGTDLLVRIPESDAPVTQSVYWRQDINPADREGSLGIYMRVSW
ncbi:hypothetical protein B0T18DRAFT_413064 [Schizothecium vesticola]|uniref:Ubiquitin 3 binding protein But2 C-terminal domain-containing protein n=1 Tax=Schizothecium vesticola TaxID=314040 RepID=A0AA40K5W5_9PEZI|nr:hypothetical protein B0T18DRAFT_413064 [Schizothecium vesticola]